MSLPSPTSPTPRKTRTYSGVAAEERTKLRRERLIAAAQDVFGMQGYAKSTMRDICASARLAERYFYESFASTDEIFHAVYKDQVRAMMTAINQAIGQAPLNSTDMAREGIRAFLQFIQDDPRRVQIVLIDGVWIDQMKAQGEGSDLVTYTEVVRTMAHALCPDLSPQIDMQMVASGLLAMAIHTAVAWARSGFKADIESVLGHNMYAWNAMRQWVQSVTPGPALPDEKRRARIRAAFDGSAPG